MADERRSGGAKRIVFLVAVTAVAVAIPLIAVLLLVDDGRDDALEAPDVGDALAVEEPEIPDVAADLAINPDDCSVPAMKEIAYTFPLTDLTAVDIGPVVGLGFHTRTWSALVADLDVDGDDDVALVRHRLLVEAEELTPLPDCLIRNDGGSFVHDGVRGLFPGGADRHECIADDVDGDDRPDVFCTVGADIGRGTGSNELWLQAEDGTFRDEAGPWRVTDDVGRGRVPTFLDVDGDDRPDLFIGNQPNRQDDRISANRLLVNAGDHFATAPELGLDLEIGSRCAVPLPGDGPGDDLLLCSDQGVRLFANGGPDGFDDVTEDRGLPIDTLAEDAVAHDLDADGTPDVAIVRRERVEIYYGGPDGYELGFVEAVHRGHALAVGDVNGDGRPDLFVVQTGDECSDAATPHDDRDDLLLLGDGTRDGWSTLRIPPLRSTAVGTPGVPRPLLLGCGDDVVAIDRDGDGRDEMLVLNGAGRTGGPLRLIEFR